MISKALLLKQMLQLSFVPGKTLASDWHICTTMLMPHKKTSVLVMDLRLISNTSSPVFQLLTCAVYCGELATSLDVIEKLWAEPRSLRTYVGFFICAR